MHKCAIVITRQTDKTKKAGDEVMHKVIFLKKKD